MPPPLGGSSPVPDDNFDEEGIALAQQLAEGPAEVMGMAKQILMRTFESSLDDLMLYEDLGQSLAQSSAEFNEGLEALKARREADFLSASESDPVSNGLPRSLSGEND